MSAFLSRDHSFQRLKGNLNLWGVWFTCCQELAPDTGLEEEVDDKDLILPDEVVGHNFQTVAIWYSESCKEIKKLHGNISYCHDQIAKLEQENKIEIINKQRIFSGSYFIEGHSLIVWRPKI